MKKLNLFSFLAVSLILGACGSKNVSTQAYEGAPKPLSEVALVKPLLHVDINAIDGDTSKNAQTFGAFGSTEHEIAITPGKHTFLLSYSGTAYQSVEELSVEMNAEAGKKYIIRPVFADKKWSAKFEDVTNDPSRWCVLWKGC